MVQAWNMARVIVSEEAAPGLPETVRIPSTDDGKLVDALQSSVSINRRIHG